MTPDGPSSDLGALAELWTAARPSPRGPASGEPATAEVAQSLRTALCRDGLEAFVAQVERRDVGFLVLSRGPLMPLLDQVSISVEHLFVLEDARRLGVGRALLARATTCAEQVGAAQISTSVLAQGREVQRFFARLGFSPFLVRRVTTVPALRRRLCPEDHVDATVVRRRSLRARSRSVALRARPSA